MNIALDATYSLDDNLSGVGVYSREILNGLAAMHPAGRFTWCARTHRFGRALRTPAPSNVRWRPLLDPLPTTRAGLFHGLNQRMPAWRAKRTVCTFHDLFVISGEYSTPDFRARFERLARDAARRSDLIIAVSEFTASQVHDLLGVERARLRAVPHGVAMPAHVPSVAEREPMVLAVGAIQRRKNTARLVEAFERLPDNWRLVLAGSVSRGFAAGDIVERIERSPARSRIELTGWVDDPVLTDLYRRASIFALPSLDEGFGIPVLEAMGFGIPVVTSRRSAMPEAAGDAAVLIDPESVDELGDALVRMAADVDLRERLASAGRDRARQYPWTRAVQGTWSVYRELGLAD